jgi:hypothetical protein
MVGEEPQQKRAEQMKVDVDSLERMDERTLLNYAKTFILFLHERYSNPNGIDNRQIDLNNLEQMNKDQLLSYATSFVLLLHSLVGNSDYLNSTFQRGFARLQSKEEEE